MFFLKMDLSWLLLKRTTVQVVVYVKKPLSKESDQILFTAHE